MAKSRQKFSNQDSSLSPTAARSREWDGPSRWADYLGTDTASPLSSTSSRNFVHDGQSQGTTPSQSHKGLNMQWVVQLTDVAEGLWLRCIVIAGSEFVRLKREHQYRLSLTNGHASEGMDPELSSHMSAEASINSTLQLFVKLSAEIILDSWSKTHRSHLVAQLIFLDQLCEISPYLPRSSLETHVPYAILRSVYSQYYADTPSTPLAIMSASPRHSPALRHPREDSTSPYYSNDSGYSKGSSSHSLEHLYHADISSLRNTRPSGPLDYGANQNKVKSVEGSTSGSNGPSPLPRFAVSRSGPLAYK